MSRDVSAAGTRATDLDVEAEVPQWRATLTQALSKSRNGEGVAETSQQRSLSRQRSPWGEEVAYMPLSLQSAKGGHGHSSGSDDDGKLTASAPRAAADLPTDGSTRVAPPQQTDAEDWRKVQDWQKKHQAHIAAARMIQRLNMREAGVLRVERHSVYGAAITMPQLGRSSGWHKYLTSLALRAYFFLITNYMIQGMLLSLVQKEENVMDLFSGAMYLCDFGAHKNSCEGEGCLGPGGTQVTPPRMYSFQAWALRSFVRDSLKLAFPEHAKVIDEKVDPGEYGVESWLCRALCCAIFMMSCMSELSLLRELCQLLYYVPTTDEMWIEPRAKDDKKDSNPETAYLDHMRITIAGMPAVWKLINIVVVLIPKALLWKITCEAGVMFLMETSGIEELIVNSVALAFVLNIDEMMCQTLMSQVTIDLLGELEDFHLYDSKMDAEAEALSDDEVMERHNQVKGWRFKDIPNLLVPWKVVCVVALTTIFMMEYYLRNCVWSHGRWISKDMYLPVSTEDFGFWHAFFPNLFRVDTETDPFWTRAGVGLEVES